MPHRALFSVCVLLISINSSADSTSDETVDPKHHNLLDKIVRLLFHNLCPNSALIVQVHAGSFVPHVPRKKSQQLRKRRTCERRKFGIWTTTASKSFKIAVMSLASQDCAKCAGWRTVAFYNDSIKAIYAKVASAEGANGENLETRQQNLVKSFKIADKLCP